MTTDTQREALRTLMGPLQADIDTMRDVYMGREQRAAYDRIVAAALAAPAPVRGEVEWRLLTDADTIEATDEHLCDDVVTWRAVGETFATGRQFRAGFYQPMRRRIAAHKQEGNGHG